MWAIDCHAHLHSPLQSTTDAYKRPPHTPQPELSSRGLRGLFRSTGESWLSYLISATPSVLAPAQICELTIYATRNRNVLNFLCSIQNISLQLSGGSRRLPEFALDTNGTDLAIPEIKCSEHNGTLLQWCSSAQHQSLKICTNTNCRLKIKMVACKQGLQGQGMMRLTCSGSGHF
jgi:hypothetical protein